MLRILLFSPCDRFHNIDLKVNVFFFLQKGPFIKKTRKVPLFQQIGCGEEEHVQRQRKFLLFHSETKLDVVDFPTATLFPFYLFFVLHSKLMY